MLSLILSIIVFSAAMSFTPGPVNTISMSIGLNRGLSSALPFILGASIGFTVLFLSVGLGMGVLSVQFKQVLFYFGLVGAGYIVYLGYLITRSEIDDLSGNSKEREQGFISGVLLQWLNPKAWSACLAGSAAFAVSESYSRLVLFNGIYLIVCFLGITFWAYIGALLNRHISNSRVMSVLNKGLGLSLILVGGYLLWFDVW